MIKVVFATSNTNPAAFGNNDELPWPHNKKDLELFKQETLGFDLIMGPGTFRSLPGILKDRKHIVILLENNKRPANTILTKNGKPPHEIRYVKSYDDLSNLKNSAIIGGKDIILQAVNFADLIIKTTIIGEFEHTVGFTKEELKFNHKLKTVNYYDGFYVEFYTKE